jgi:uncharacterized membrane protein
MTRSDSTGTLAAPSAALIVCAVVYVLMSSQHLPELVASHFDAAGRANGQMPRGAYVATMLAIIVIMPLLTAFVPSLMLSSPNARINLPNRDYWLAPERRAESIRFLSRQMWVFSWLVVLVLCYVHSLAVRANTVTPPAIDSAALERGLIVFLVCALAWAVWLIGHFRKGP